MKPLLVLLIVFGLALGLIRLIAGGADYSLAGRIAMSVMLLFTSIGHFRFLEGMAMMMPHGIPYKKQFVVLTGILEIAAAALLLIPATVYITGFLLIIFFLMILPANIHAAMHHIDFEKATATGKGSAYLWFRIPLQFFFIAWVYLFAICLR